MAFAPRRRSGRSLSPHGRFFSWRSQFSGISDDFTTKAGFTPRRTSPSNVTPVSLGMGRAVTGRNRHRHRLRRHLGVPDFFRAATPRQEVHFNFRSQLRGGWTAGFSILVESFGYDPAYYGNLYRIEVPRPGLPSDTLPFTGTARFYNTDYVVSVGTPKLKFVSFNGVFIHGLDEDFYEWSGATLDYLSLTADVRPSQQLRIGATYLLIDHKRLSDGTRVDRVRDPRLRSSIS